MQCREFGEMVDSYLKDELLVETNHGVITHLEACPACRSELAARRETREALRRAFDHAPEFQLRPEFAFQLRNELKMEAFGKRNNSDNLFAFVMRPQWLAIAACLVVAGMVGIFAFRPQGGSPNELARTATSGEVRSDLPAGELSGAAVRLASFEKTEAAIGDHQNCAIKYNLPEEPIDLNEAGRKYDTAYIDLAQAVRSGEGLRAGDIKYVEDHSCIYDGRRFAHIILEHKGRTISLLVAETDEDSTKGENADVIACSQRDGFQVSCFGTKRHSVFVVSDSTEADNLMLARRLAPTVTKHIARAEV
ncbi:MAG: zf-HC2 domain-containing protein [Pyrinomonadaceae bacterium]|nr:zf-HC2 domain-containing protein [Pyrinomonadaceae bacterium]